MLVFMIQPLSTTATIEDMALNLWVIRTPQSKDFDPSEQPSIFSLKFNHGGKFTNFPCRTYVYGKIDYVDMVGRGEFSVQNVNAMMEELGYAKDEVIYYHFRVSDGDLDFDLKPLSNRNDVLNLLRYIHKHKIIDVYTKHEDTRVKNNSLVPKRWVSDVYWLDTWKKVPTTLKPPKHHNPIGRPNKKRKKSVEELSQSIAKGGKID
ncbi:hypothetical protein R6Q57_010799 [Mikania cordata]